MTNVPILDLEALQEAKAMMKAKFPTMVQYFLEDSQSYLEEIQTGISQANLSKLIPAAHTLKSSSRQMGAILMSDMAKNIEALARDISDQASPDMAPLLTLLPPLERTFAQTREAFEPYLAG
jgi:HPt (histidine-containing phosphotransfer) domain-containing protein